jgi:hypothetical protein
MNDAGQTMTAAYTELVEDTVALCDPDRAGYVDSAVAVSLDRTGFGDFEVNVRLHQIAGSQIAFVLAVARKYELDVREEGGWLTLSRHFTDSDSESTPEPETTEVSA